MSGKQYRLVIMFADVSGSTKLFETVGDNKARSLIAQALVNVTKIIHENKGKVIKTIGDEIMCIFPKPEEAITTSTSIHEMLENTDFDGTTLKMRIGFCQGPVILEVKDGKQDVYGDAVNVAARMAAQAKADQTILPEETVQKLPDEMQEDCRFVDTAPIKGKKEEIRIYEAIWKQEDATCMALPGNMQNTLSSDNMPNIKMHLEYRNKKALLDKEHPSLVIGRSKQCDMPVDEDLASRNHVKLELRRGKIFIIDQSTNGTHVRHTSGEDTFLRREEMLLTGNGQISLGKAFDEQPTEVVNFSLTATDS